MIGAMCRSIKTLREPFTAEVTDADIQAAALQYVRRSRLPDPGASRRRVFDEAVRAVTAATATLLDGLVVRGTLIHRSARDRP